MVLGGTPTEWLTLLALVAGPGLVATVLWSPVLVVGRLRALFRALPVTGSTGLNYVVVAMTLSGPWILALGWALAETGGQVGAGTAAGEPLFTVAFQVGGVYAAGLPLLAGFALPELGVDWDPTGYGTGTWIVLVGASIWYAAIYAVPTFLMGVIISL